jgi:Bifunctional DNA primase/polymerase, N-terminal/Primase C terminal 2 (PriCT-2)
MSFIDFVKAGLSVFEIMPIVNGVCRCGCEKGGKHPVSKNWQSTQPLSIEKLQDYQKGGRLKNFGVVVRGLLVLDIDTGVDKNGVPKVGDDSMRELVEKIPALRDCGFIVKTGGGGYHYYFALDDDLPLWTNHPDFPDIDFKSSGYVIGPGSAHISGNDYKVIRGAVSDISPAPAELLALLTKPDHVRVSGGVDISAKEIAEMLSFIDPDCEEPTWRLIGGAIHHLTSGSMEGLSIFDYWSKQGEKYTGWQSCVDKWSRYGNTPSPAGVGTLRHLAEAGGYVEPVTFVSGVVWDDVEPPVITPATVAEVGPALVVEDTIDLQRPPGFVGDVCRWINGQCIKPRERLATAAALAAVGNVAGLQYEDDLPGGNTTNLFIVVIAASGSGKNAVKNAISHIHRVAGMSRVTYGKSKSSQELYRALIAHQSCLFNIDELGIKFQAIANAGKSGASYYETWFGEMMSIYSNAAGTVDLQEDEYREIEKQLTAQAQFYREKIDSNEDPDGKFAKRLELVEKKLAGDLALVNPFLSMIGYSTPERFDAMVTPERVTEGFIGRCLLVREPVDVVQRKRDFKPLDMPWKLTNTLLSLATGGRTGHDIDVLCNYDKRVKIKTTADALAELDRLTDYFEALESHYEAVNGMHAIPTRAEELVRKISFILSVADGVRTLENVKWAAAYVMRDIEIKVSLAVGNSKDVDALQNKILANLTRDEFVSTAQIRNRCRPITVKDLTNILEKMEKAGLITRRTENDKRAPEKIIVKWGLV